MVRDRPQPMNHDGPGGYWSEVLNVTSDPSGPNSVPCHATATSERVPTPPKECVLALRRPVPHSHIDVPSMSPTRLHSSLLWDPDQPVGW